MAPAPERTPAAWVAIGAHSAAHPEVVYAFAKYRWHSARKDAAITPMSLLTDALEAGAVRVDGEETQFDDG